MKIIILGASGQLGKSFFKNKLNNMEIIFFSKDDLNLLNYKLLEIKITKHKPDFLINTAAFTNVDEAETNNELAFEINSKSLVHLSQLCDKNDVCLIHFSTEYVFEGNKNESYVEDDDTNPLSIYGKSKLEGEINIKLNTKKYFIFRISWLFSNHYKSFVNKIINKRKSNEIINVVNDQFGKPMYSDELAKIIYDFIINYENNNPKFGIYHISAKGNICSWYEIAKFVAEYAKSKNVKFPKINKISSNQYKALALRPKNSCLNDAKFKIINEFNQINWEKHLANMLEEIFNK